MLFFTASDLSSITSYIHSWVLFQLWLHPFILSGVISPLIFSSILWTYKLGNSPFSVLSFYLFILFIGFSRQEYWSGLPFPSPVDHILSDLSTMPACLGWPHRTWLSFIELDKAVVLVWLDWLAFCDYGFSVSTLWCPLATPTVLLGFLLPWTRGISSHAPAKPLLLTLDEEYLLTAGPPDLERGVAPLGPPAPAHPNKYSENQGAISKWQKCNKNGKKLVPESIHLVIVLSCGQMAIGQNVSDFT